MPELAPEQQARENIDSMLAAAGWAISKSLPMKSSPNAIKQTLISSGSKMMLSKTAPISLPPTSSGQTSPLISKQPLSSLGK